MGLSLNVDVNNENEFNQQLQLYLAQGYSMQSNFNGTAILKKKSYSMGLLIVLIIFFFPAAIIYYLVASDDVVTITNRNGQTSGNASTANTTTESYDAFCEECGHGLYNDSKFCPGCGRNLSAPIEDTTEEESLKCENCGAEITEENRFCPECGTDLSMPVEDEAEEIEVIKAEPEKIEETEEKVLKCENCGKELTEDKKFCPECGEKITADDEEL